MVPIRSSVAALCLLAISLPIVYGEIKIEANGKDHRVFGTGFEVATKNLNIIKAETVNGGKSTVFINGVKAGTYYQTSFWKGKNGRGEEASVEIKVIGEAAWTWTQTGENLEIHFINKPRTKNPKGRGQRF